MCFDDLLLQEGPPFLIMSLVSLLRPLFFRFLRLAWLNVWTFDDRSYVKNKRISFLDGFSAVFFSFSIALRILPRKSC